MKSKTQFDHNIQTSSRGSESRQPVGGKKKKIKVDSRHPDSKRLNHKRSETKEKLRQQRKPTSHLPLAVHCSSSQQSFRIWK